LGEGSGGEGGLSVTTLEDTEYEPDKKTGRRWGREGGRGGVMRNLIWFVFVYLFSILLIMILFVILLYLDFVLDSSFGFLYLVEFVSSSRQSCSRDNLQIDALIEIEYFKYSLQRHGGTGIRGGDEWVVHRDCKAHGVDLGLQRDLTLNDVERMYWLEEHKQLQIGGMGGVGGGGEDIQVKVQFGSVHILVDIDTENSYSDKDKHVYSRSLAYNDLSEQYRTMVINKYLIHLTFYDNITCLDIEFYSSYFNQIHRINKFLNFFNFFVRDFQRLRIIRKSLNKLRRNKKRSVFFSVYLLNFNSYKIYSSSFNIFSYVFYKFDFTFLSAILFYTYSSSILSVIDSSKSTKHFISLTNPFSSSFKKCMYKFVFNHVIFFYPVVFFLSNGILFTLRKHSTFTLRHGQQLDYDNSFNIIVSSLLSFIHSSSSFCVKINFCSDLVLYSTYLVIIMKDYLFIRFFHFDSDSVSTEIKKEM
jgi:hypothetical protein